MPVEIDDWKFLPHLELDVASTGEGAPGAEDLQSYIAVAVCDLKPSEDILATTTTRPPQQQKHQLYRDNNRKITI